jgi:hypothetical protein
MLSDLKLTADQALLLRIVCFSRARNPAIHRPPLILHCETVSPSRMFTPLAVGARATSLSGVVTR